MQVNSQYDRVNDSIARQICQANCQNAQQQSQQLRSVVPNEILLHLSSQKNLSKGFEPPGAAGMNTMNLTHAYPSRKRFWSQCDVIGLIQKSSID